MIGLLSGASGYYRKAQEKYDGVSRRADADVTRAFMEIVNGAPNAPRAHSMPKSSSVILEFALIKYETIQMMAELPADVNTEIAEIIREQVRAGDWPKDIESSNAAIKLLIEESLRQPD